MSLSRPAIPTGTLRRPCPRAPRGSGILGAAIVALCACFSLGGQAYGATHAEIDTFVVVADGDLVAWTASGCVTESDCVDEKPATTDDATTYLKANLQNRQQYATVSFRWIAAQYTQIDSAKIYVRFRYTATSGASASMELQFDTMGVDTDLDTIAPPPDNTWHDYTTDNSITGLTTTNTETIEIGIRTLTAGVFPAEFQMSTLALIVFGQSDDNIWYCNDTVMISTGGVGSGNNDLWYDASAVGFLFCGSVSTTNLRSLIGIHGDSVKAHLTSKTIDSAFLYVYEDTLVGSPVDAGVFMVTIRGDTAGVYRINKNTSASINHSEKTYRARDPDGVAADTLQWAAVSLDTNDLDTWKVRLATLNGDSVANGNFRHKVDVTVWMDSIKESAGTFTNTTNNGHGLFIRALTEAGSGNHYWSARGPYPMSQQAQHNEQMYIAVYTSDPAGGIPGRRRKIILGDPLGLVQEATGTFAGSDQNEVAR